MAQTTTAEKCMSCHKGDHVMPALFKQYSKSLHFKKNVTCIDCHGAKKNDVDAFEHHGDFISVVVSPKDCKKCHEKAVKEFNQSAHAHANTLVTTGLGGYFLKNLAGSQQLPNQEKYAAGITGCLRCHGSEIKIDKSGHPTANTWPNSGIGRINPDGSIGNCSACHERHEFSLSQARQPESCAICHNSGGGDPQIEAYNTSRHGTTYHASKNQMNLNAASWIVGKDYFAAPTCATCHMSATADMPATHNINLRMDWSHLLQKTNTLAAAEKCGLPVKIQKRPYKQPIPDGQHRDNMKKVCRACHSETLVNNFLSQYESEVKLYMTKWIIPGKKLFQLATKVLQAVKKDKYEFMTNSIDLIWFGMCNGDAKSAYTGAAMMSAGLVEEGNGGFAASWYSSFIPTIQGMINEHKDSQGAVKQAVDNLKKAFDEIQANPVYSGPWHM